MDKAKYFYPKTKQSLNMIDEQVNEEIQKSFQQNNLPPLSAMIKLNDKANILKMKKLNQERRAASTLNSKRFQTLDYQQK